MKEPIPDVPAVYFCEPTLENVKRIAKDSADRLYKVVQRNHPYQCILSLYLTHVCVRSQVMHVNFPSKIERPVLEAMAK